MQRLEELLLAHPEAEAHYVQYMSLHADLVRHFAGPTRMPAAWERSGPTQPRRLMKRRLLWAVILLGLLAAGFIPAFPHLQAWYHLRAARSALDHYHNSEAIRHLQGCLRVWPDDADALARSSAASAGSAMRSCTISTSA